MDALSTELGHSRGAAKLELPLLAIGLLLATGRPALVARVTGDTYETMRKRALSHAEAGDVPMAAEGKRTRSLRGSNFRETPRRAGNFPEVMASDQELTDCHFYLLGSCNKVTDLADPTRF